MSRFLHTTIAALAIAKATTGVDARRAAEGLPEHKAYYCKVKMRRGQRLFDLYECNKHGVVAEDGDGKLIPKYKNGVRLFGQDMESGEHMELDASTPDDKLFKARVDSFLPVGTDYLTPDEFVHYGTIIY